MYTERRPHGRVQAEEGGLGQTLHHSPQNWEMIDFPCISHPACNRSPSKQVQPHRAATTILGSHLCYHPLFTSTELSSGGVTCLSLHGEETSCSENLNGSWPDSQQIKLPNRICHPQTCPLGLRIIFELKAIGMK